MSMYNRTSELKRGASPLARRNSSDLQFLFSTCTFSIDWGDCMLWLIKINTSKWIQWCSCGRRNRSNTPRHRRGVTLLREHSYLLHGLLRQCTLQINTMAGLCLLISKLWLIGITKNGHILESPFYLVTKLTITSCLSTCQMGSSWQGAYQDVCIANFLCIWEQSCDKLQPKKCTWKVSRSLWEDSLS